MSGFNRPTPSTGPIIGQHRVSIESTVAALEKKLGAQEKKIEQLLKKIEALEKTVAVDTAGDVTIRAKSFTLDSTTTVRIKTGAVMTLLSAGRLELQSAAITLNGGKPLARIGDTVTVTGPVGVIVTGNPTVMG